MYDPQIGRFHTLDPLAELTHDWTPYHYVYNNPLRLVDPTGMIPEDQEEKRKEEEKTLSEFIQDVYEAGGTVTWTNPDGALISVKKGPESPEQVESYINKIVNQTIIEQAQVDGEKLFWNAAPSHLRPGIFKYQVTKNSLPVYKYGRYTDPTIDWVTVIQIGGVNITVKIQMEMFKTPKELSSVTLKNENYMRVWREDYNIDFYTSDNLNGIIMSFLSKEEFDKFWKAVSNIQRQTTLSIANDYDISKGDVEKRYQYTRWKNYFEKLGPTEYVCPVRYENN